MSKYKGMTNYGVLIQDIKDYAEEVGKDPTEVWKMCIDKMVENGADECEGYSGGCQNDYIACWKGDLSLYVDVDVGTLHSGFMPETLVTVKELLGVSDIMTEPQDSREEPLVVWAKTSKEELDDEMDKDTPTLPPLQLKLYGGEDVLQFMKDNTNIVLDPVNMSESNEASRRLLGTRDGVVVVEIVVVEV